MSPLKLLAFRTLAGTHTIDVRPNETNEAALARHFGVDARRIVLQVLDGEWCAGSLLHLSRLELPSWFH
jgi:hypothetical protein